MTSLVPYTLEEAYEVADAVERGAIDDIRDELGDLLFHVVFYCQIAHEEGWFDFEDVATIIVAKLEQRHPEVFSTVDKPEKAIDWEDHKWEERRQKALCIRGNPVADLVGVPGALSGVAMALPSLSRAVKLQKRAARVGFDWAEVQQVIAKVLEELDEVQQEIDEADADRLLHEVGDLLLATSNLARHLKVDPEQALRSANQRFEHRFEIMENQLAKQGKTVDEQTPAQLEMLWEVAKKQASYL